MTPPTNQHILGGYKQSRPPHALTGASGCPHFPTSLPTTAFPRCLQLTLLPAPCNTKRLDLPLHPMTISFHSINECDSTTKLRAVVPPSQRRTISSPSPNSSLSTPSVVTSSADTHSYSIENITKCPRSWLPILCYSRVPCSMVSSTRLKYCIVRYLRHTLLLFDRECRRAQPHGFLESLEVAYTVCYPKEQARAMSSITNVASA